MSSNDLRLERLNRRVHEAAFVEFAREFRDAREGQFDAFLADPDGYFELADRFENDRDLPEDRVPQSHFLFFDGDRLIGGSRLRRRLISVLLLDGGHIGYEVRPSARRNGYGAEILRQTLLEAKSLDVSKVLLTAATTNFASIRMIEDARGVFDGESLSPRTGEAMRRYWIEV